MAIALAAISAKAGRPVSTAISLASGYAHMSGEADQRTGCLYQSDSIPYWGRKTNSIVFLQLKALDREFDYLNESHNVNESHNAVVRTEDELIEFQLFH